MNTHLVDGRNVLSESNIVGTQSIRKSRVIFRSVHPDAQSHSDILVHRSGLAKIRAGRCSATLPRQVATAKLVVECGCSRRDVLAECGDGGKRR